MFTIETDIIIDAPPQLVWDVLLDFGQYQEWSTMLHYEGGKAELGEQLTLRLTPPEGAGYSFSPTITRLDEPREFSWVGVTGIRGVFDGEHIFILEALDNEQTRLINREEYRGLASPIVQRIGVLNGAEAGFQQMNQEIKARVESLIGVRS